MLPAELKSLKRWVNWRWAPDGHGKIPLQSCDKPETWLDFETAKSRCVKSEDKAKMIGLGIQLGDGLVGIDLDWKHWETTKPWETIPDYARQIIDEQRSYTEWSPSGRGVHIYCRSDSFKGTLKTKNVEIYSGNRFFTVTGRGLEGTEESINSFNGTTYRAHAESHERGVSGRERTESSRTDEKIPVGLRNNDLASYAGALLRGKRATSEAELLDLLKARARHRHVDGDPEDSKLESLAARFWAKYAEDPELEEDYEAAFSTLVPEKIEWLIDNRIPLGELICFCGDPGVGKSTAAHEYAAQRSKLGDRVLIIQSEESRGWMKERAELMGGNLDNIREWGITKIDDRRKTNVFDASQLRHQDKLREKIKKDNIKLVVIDPITSFLGEVKLNQEAEVRPALIELRNIAEDLGVAIIYVLHNNKTNTVNAIDKVSHARAFTGVPRFVWSFTCDPEDADAGVMAATKAKHLRGQEYKLVGRKSSLGNDIRILVWGNAVDMTGDDALAARAEKLSKDKIDAILEDAKTKVEMGCSSPKELKKYLASSYKISTKKAERILSQAPWLEITGHTKSQKLSVKEEDREITLPEYL